MTGIAPYAGALPWNAPQSSDATLCAFTPQQSSLVNGPGGALQPFQFKSHSVDGPSGVTPNQAPPTPLQASTSNRTAEAAYYAGNAIHASEFCLRNDFSAGYSFPPFVEEPPYFGASQPIQNQSLHLAMLRDAETQHLNATNQFLEERVAVLERNVLAWQAKAASLKQQQTIFHDLKYWKPASDALRKMHGQLVEATLSSLGDVGDTFGESVSKEKLVEAGLEYSASVANARSDVQIPLGVAHRYVVRPYVLDVRHQMTYRFSRQRYSGSPSNPFVVIRLMDTVYPHFPGPGQHACFYPATMDVINQINALSASQAIFSLLVETKSDPGTKVTMRYLGEYTVTPRGLKMALCLWRDLEEEVGVF